MGDVIHHEWDTLVDLPPARVLSAATDADLRHCVVLGRSADGEEYFASSTADAGQMLLLLRRFEQRLLAEEFGPIVSR